MSFPKPEQNFEESSVPSKLNGKVEIMLYARFSDLWDSCLREWLRGTVDLAWKETLPSLLLVPHRNFALFIKSKMMEEMPGFVGLRIWTPQECRQFLQSHFKVPLAVTSRDMDCLLLGLAAESAGGETLSNALTRDPALFLEAFEGLVAAGYDPGKVMRGVGGKTADEVARLLETLGWVTGGEVDALQAESGGKETLFSRCGICGFTAEHWELRSLLRTVSGHSATTWMAFPMPRWKGEEVDQTWVESWEEYHGATAVALPSGDEEVSPFLGLAERLEAGEEGQSGEACERGEAVRFILSEDAGEEARNIVDEVRLCLAEGGARARVGVLVPRAGVLSRKLSQVLAEAEIPHYDAMGHWRPGPFEARDFHAWLRYAEQPRLERFLFFLETCPHAWSGGVTLSQVIRSTRRAFRQVLSDDLRVLAAHLEAGPGEHDGEVATLLAEWGDWPERAQIDVFWGRVEAWFRRLGWEHLLSSLRRQVLRLEGIKEREVTRTLWVTWLASVCQSWLRVRDEGGNEVFARVHLLPYERAEGQTWSHLILAGLNEDGWPTKQQPNGFLSETAIRKLNRDVICHKGSQGDGQCFVDLKAHGYLLGPVERRWIAQRQFFNILETARERLIITASKTSYQDSKKEVAPGDFWNRLYLAARGEVWTEEASSTVRPRCYPRVAREEEISELKMRASTKAFLCRRRSGEAFGAYEFALRSKPRRAIALSAGDWDTWRNQSGVLWLKHCLGVVRQESILTDEVVAQARGTLVHRWLRDSVSDPEGDGLLQDEKKLLSELRRLAAWERRYLDGIYDKARRKTPVWVAGLIEQAERLALRFGARLGALQVGGERLFRATSEYSLPSGMAIKLKGEWVLRLKGRIDLVLQSADGKESEPWIIDFKTGNANPLSAKGLTRGEGIQVALYVLAFHQLLGQGGRGSISLVDHVLEPQVTLEDVLQASAIWEGMTEAQDMAVFGWRGKLRDFHAPVAEYPLATLPVEEGVLEEKWAITHPWSIGFKKQGF